MSNSEFPDYKNYVIQPMDLSRLEQNIKDNVYGSTHAFESDASWLLHNSIVFNSSRSDLHFSKLDAISGLLFQIILSWRR